MPIISAEIRTVIWVITGIATILFTVLSIVLEPNLAYLLRQAFPKWRRLGGRKPTSKPFLLWLLFIISSLTVIAGTAIAGSAPDDAPLAEIIDQAIPPLTEPVLVRVATESPTLTPTSAPARVLIVLDVSNRMADELDEPGATKLDVARNAIIQLLNTFQGNSVEVALSYISDSGSQACEISRDPLGTVDFTQNFQHIWQVLSTTSPYESSGAPLVDALGTVLREKKTGNDPLTLFIFTGGDDTCNKSVELFFKARQNIPGNTVNFETFLILLLGKENPPSWATEELGVSLGLARTAREVDQLTETFGNEVVSSLHNYAPDQNQSGPVIQTPSQANATASGARPQWTSTTLPAATPTPSPTFTIEPSPLPTFTFTVEAPKPFLILHPGQGTSYGCNPPDLCIQSVTVQWLPEGQTGNLHLSIWVKPYPGDPIYRYYSQASPYYIGNSQWTSTEVYIGDENNPAGIPFRIYALVTDTEYSRGEDLPGLPPSIQSAYVDVVR